MSRPLAALGDVPAVRQALALVTPLPAWNVDKRPLWQRVLEARQGAPSAVRVAAWKATPKCTSDTDKGVRCRRPAAKGSDICSGHASRHTCGKCGHRIGGDFLPCKCPGAPKLAAIYGSAPPREGSAPRGRPRRSA